MFTTLTHIWNPLKSWIRDNFWHDTEAHLFLLLPLLMGTIHIAFVWEQQITGLIVVVVIVLAMGRFIVSGVLRTYAVAIMTTFLIGTVCVPL